MITFLACAGYKHFGQQPPLSYRPGSWEEFRDNMLYLNVKFTDWQHDQQMLRFVLDTHSKSLSFEYFEQRIQAYVQANETPALHIMVWQHSADTADQLQVSITTEEPVVERFGQVAVTAAQYIERKRSYYAGEYARYEEESAAEARRFERRPGQRRSRAASADLAPSSFPVPFPTPEVPSGFAPSTIRLGARTDETSSDASQEPPFYGDERDNKPRRTGGRGRRSGRSGEEPPL